MHFRTMTTWSLTALLGLTTSTRAESPAPSYHKDVSPILQKHCQDCHRPGQVAPFSLLTYRDARKRAHDLVQVTEAKTMPPWHASTTEGGPFRDVRVLSPAEIEALAAWVEAGAPEGNPTDAPPSRTFSSEWALGPPDLVLTVPEPLTLGAEGRDEFRVFVLPTGLTEGKWIRTVDFRPGNARVVHHVLGAYDASGKARTFDAADPLPGYRVTNGFGTTSLGLPFFPTGGLSGWAPGKLARPLPAGVGRYLPAGSDVLIQVHYHKSGKVETDASSVGLYFEKDSVRRQVVMGMVLPPPAGFRPALRLKAGDPNAEITGSMTLEEDYHIVGVIPHMHWLGKDFLLTATSPDGRKRTLIRIDRWNFNWQNNYDFAEPVALPTGTRLDMVAHFDNSESNPVNPSRPPVDVTWGEETTNEMCIGFLQLTRDAEALTGLEPPKERPRPVINFFRRPARRAEP